MSLSLLLRVYDVNYGVALISATVGALVTAVASVVCFVAGLVAAKPHAHYAHRTAAVGAPVVACAVAAAFLVPVPAAAEWVSWAAPVGATLVASAVVLVGVVVAPIGLTGGIASGKSTVSRRLAAHHGVAIVDADVVAREVVEVGQPAYKDIVATFGTQVLNDDAQRTLNRAALAKLVFSNREARRRLNKITHGRIARRMLRQLLTFSLLKRKPVVLDAPLLLDAAPVVAKVLCSCLVAVHVDPETQLRRAVARDGTSEADVQARIAAQMSPADRAARCHHVIVNDGTEGELTARVDELWTKLRSERAWLAVS